MYIYFPKMYVIIIYLKMMTSILDIKIVKRQTEEKRRNSSAVI